MEEQPWGFDPSNRGAWAVLHVPDLEAPVPAEVAAKSTSNSLPLRNVRFIPIKVYPSADREAVASLSLTEVETDRYIDLTGSVFGDDPRHQVGGFPDPVQGDHMELECQLASHGVYCGTGAGYRSEAAARLQSGAAEWRLLFQIGCDDELGAMWGDAGNLYFWIEESKAREGRFEDAWLVLQCG